MTIFAVIFFIGVVLALAANFLDSDKPLRQKLPTLFGIAGVCLMIFGLVMSVAKLFS